MQRKTETLITGILHGIVSCRPAKHLKKPVRGWFSDRIDCIVSIVS